MIIFMYIMFGFLLLNMYRMVRGPEVFDRLVALNIASDLVIIIMCAISIYTGISFYLDIAIIYAILSFSGIIAFTKYFKKL